MTKCEKCFFCKITKTSGSFGTIRNYECFVELDDNPSPISEDILRNGCENFGNLNKANELFNNQERYEWKNFNGDKRTAHYKTTNIIRKNGADKYLTIFTWSEYNYFDGVQIYAFWHEKSLVHYNDGTFKVHKFRSVENGKCGKEM